MTRPRPIEGLLAAILAIAASVAVAACGISADEPEAGVAAPSAAAEEPAATPPPRQLGVIRVGAAQQDELIGGITDGYRATINPVEVTEFDLDDADAFQEFCEGGLDVAYTDRPITAEELAACTETGLRPVQFQIASDAVVVAIRNETDVGVDCMTLDQVRETFRAGSPVLSWSQVGYDLAPDSDAGSGTGESSPLAVAGTGPGSGSFDFLARNVLGAAEPSLAAVRSDYLMRSSSEAVRETVVGDLEDQQSAALAAGAESSSEDMDAAVADAEAAVEVARDEVAKGIADERSAADQQADLDRLAAAEAKVRDLRAEAEALGQTADVTAAAADRLARRYGRLGVFPYAFYSVYEEQLRPMEIDDGSLGDQPNCVFPSDETVSDGSYPLARQALLTVDLGALEDADIAAFLRYAVTSASDLAADASITPALESTLRSELEWLDGSAPPEVVAYPDSEAQTEAETPEDG